MSKSQSQSTGGIDIDQLRVPEDEEGNGSLTRDEIFEMLSNRRRRFVIQYLKNEEEAGTLSDIAEHVAAWENDSTVTDISASERKTVYSSLQQFHLPKMDETGVVEFDRRAGVVELTDTASELDIYLEVVDRYDIPWSFYYMGISAIGAILVGLASLGVQPFAAIPMAGWAVFLLGTFGVSSVSHFLLSRGMRLESADTPAEVDDV
jgi:predicted house-cleaning noncanonical NTP pyrophosphatase (MazG superfamily)